MKTSSPITISESEYTDKVYACWLGKNIGGTLGAPFEGRKYVNDLDFYGTSVKEAAPNDDLDLQLVWLRMLEREGIEVQLDKMAKYWLEHLSAYPWNEYGFCHRNLSRGLLPPASGGFENYFVDEMGSPIRSEMWACIAPANPQLAASYAWKDSCLDHSGGEGMYGEMFWASIESAAFVEKDPMKLIRIGLNMIPFHSQISRVIKEALWCYENDVRWAEAREKILDYYEHGHNQPCNAIPNHGFITLGLLYGKDFGEKLCKAVNCGYDTDCTGATLGALLGIMWGSNGIPKAWREPVGEGIVLHQYTDLDDAPKTISELAERVKIIAVKVLGKMNNVRFGIETDLPEGYYSRLAVNDLALEALRQDVMSSVRNVGDYEVWFHYNGEPVIYPGVSKTIGISVRKAGRVTKVNVKLKAPEGWLLEKGSDLFDQTRFILRASSPQGRNEIIVNFDHKRANFNILGPEEARGFPSGSNVPTCPVCHGYSGACVCSGDQKSPT